MKNGFLYVGMGKKYRMEAEISARSIRRFTKYPIALVTEDPNYSSEYFDQIILSEASSDFVSKIKGLQLTPFDRTIFLDTDTFVCLPIDELFDVLDLFDMAMSVDVFGHSRGFIQKYQPQFKIRYENVIPEFHTGVIVVKNNLKTQSFIRFWLQKHEELNLKADMPSLREAYIDFEEKVSIAPLLAEYNYYEIFSFGIIHGPVKIIHGRLGSRWSTLTRVMLPFEKMDKIANKYNKRPNIKRLLIGNVGIISANYNLWVMKNFIKKALGIKQTKKSETL